MFSFSCLSTFPKRPPLRIIRFFFQTSGPRDSAKPLPRAFGCRCGKTQLCHSLAVMAQLPSNMGGANGKALVSSRASNETRCGRFWFSSSGTAKRNAVFLAKRSQFEGCFRIGDFLDVLLEANKPHSTRPHFRVFVQARPGVRVFPFGLPWCAT